MTLKKLGWVAPALLALLGAGDVHAQVTQSSTTFKSSTNLSTCSGDKIQFSDFTVTPGNPAADQNVTVQFKIRNLCGQTLNVPYKIADYSTIRSSGTKSVAANQIASVQYSFPAAVGNHSIDAYLDENNSLNEASSYRANNGAQDVITFAVAAPTLATASVVATSAQQAGAQFLTQQATPPCLSRYVNPGGPTAIASVFAYLSGPTGCDVGTYEIFKNFTLKNGWKLKTIQVDQASGPVNSAWEWLTRPTEGSSSLYGVIRLRAANTALPTSGTLLIRLTVEGPQGTSPYN